MFERFSKNARCAIINAQEQARDSGSREIRPEHLLFALRQQPYTATSGYLVSRLGDRDLTERFRRVYRRAGLTTADAEALEQLGIDVEKLVDAVERGHGENALAGSAEKRSRWLRKALPRHLPFSREAKATLEQCLKEATALGDRELSDVHLLLGLLSRSRLVADVLAELGIDYLDARRALRGGQAQAG